MPTNGFPLVALSGLSKRRAVIISCSEAVLVWRDFFDELSDVTQHVVTDHTLVFRQPLEQLDLLELGHPVDLCTRGAVDESVRFPEKPFKQVVDLSVLLHVARVFITCPLDYFFVCYCHHNFPLSELSPRKDDVMRQARNRAITSLHLFQREGRFE